ncbi:MAG TPA: SDR family oxidoreductase [Roseiarcus sp.]|nr:SDR family oxidoreductase [Roseiarcus sp.]
MGATSFQHMPRMPPDSRQLNCEQRRGRACATSYLAYELGPRGIRVQAISPSPLKTRAAVRLKDFELLLSDAAQRRPSERLSTL